MPTADDAQLLHLATHPAEEIFLVLNRSKSLLPLLALLAVLPGLFALQYRTFREYGALWGLRSLQVATADSLDAAVDPGGEGPEAALRWQPPLGSWLTGAVMRLLGPSQVLSLYVVSYLATVGLVAMIYVLIRRLAGARLGLLAAALLACHGPFLMQAQSPVPRALALLPAIVSFWGFLAHLQDGSALVSIRLLASGIALGMCLLAGGPLAMAVLAVLLIYVLGLRGASLKKRREKPAAPRRVWVGWPALKSLAVLALTAFAVGGWWVLMMISRHGLEFLGGFLTLGYREHLLNGELAHRLAAPRGSELLWTGLLLLGGLAGFSLLGTVRAVAEILATEDDGRRRGLQFLLAWLACGLVVFLLRPRSPAMAAPAAASLWGSFAMLPAVVLAAFAGDEACRRRLHVLTVAVVSCAGLAAMMLAVSASESARNVEAARITAVWMSTLLSAAVLLIGVVWISGLAPSRDARLRFVVGALLVAHLAGNSAAGLQRVQVRDEDDRALAAFRESLQTLPTVESCLIIRERQLPLRLRFTLRSLWPKAQMQIVESWDAALSQALAETRKDREIVVLDWAAPQFRPTNLQVPGLTITQVSTPYFFEDRELRTYLLVRESQNP